MEVIMKNETTNFENIGVGEIFEIEHSFFLKIDDDRGFDVYNGEIFPFRDNVSVILHPAKLIIE